MKDGFVEARVRGILPTFEVPVISGERTVTPTKLLEIDVFSYLLQSYSLLYREVGVA